MGDSTQITRYIRPAWYLLRTNDRPDMNQARPGPPRRQSPVTNGAGEMVAPHVRTGFASACVPPSLSLALRVRFKKLVEFFKIRVGPDFSKIGTISVKIGTVYVKFDKKNQNRPDSIFFNPLNF
jgi:hypothetical protein